MSHKVLYLLAAVVLGALVLLVVELRSEPTPPSVPSQATLPAPAASTASLPSVPVRRDIAPSPPSSTASTAPAAVTNPEPEIEGVKDLGLERLFLDHATQRVLNAAAGCYSGESGRDGDIEIDYTLRIRDGEASLHNVKLTKSTVNQPALESCIVEAMTELTWKQRDKPDLDEDLGISISLLALWKRAVNDQLPWDDEEPVDPGLKQMIPLRPTR